MTIRAESDSTTARPATSALPAAGEFGTGQWQILERIARGGSLSEVLLSIVALVEQQAENMLCSILIFEAESGRLRHGAAQRLAPELCALADGARIGPGSGSCGMAASSKAPAVVTDIASHPAWRGYHEPFVARGLRACWSTPILSPAGDLLGTLGMYFAEQRGPTSEERAWVDAATHLAAIALSRAQAERENARLLSALGARLEELTLLHRSARLLATHPGTLREQLEALVAMIPSGFRCPEASRARIVWDGVEVASAGFQECPRKLTVRASTSERGVRLELVRLEAPQRGEPEFAAEERTLLESLADLIGAHVEKHSAEQLLRATLAELREKSQELEFNMRHLPLAYVVWDRELRVKEWKGAAERLFGRAAAEVVGKSSRELGLLPPGEDESGGDPLGLELRASDAGGTRGLHHHARPAGARLVCEWLHAPLEDAAGEIVGYLSMASDVTERERVAEQRAHMEAQLRQAQRLQSLGTLAGGIAHDFNNILTAIAGHTHLGLLDLDEERSPRESLLAVQDASVRATELVRRILMFSRKQQPERRVCSLAPIVDDAIELFKVSLPDRVRIERHYEAHTPPAFADPAQIHQLVINLAADAAQAVGEQGTIEVRVEPVSRRCPELAGVADERFERYIRITVRDTGCGMDEAVIERIFEPFFSTKATGQGIGLGLSVVHGIVKGHEGVVTVSSQPGKGSSLRVYLPETHALPAPRPSVHPSLPPRTSGARVLYVDDEEPLVALAARWLGRMGYEVTGFSDSTQALEAFRARPQDFDAVVSDFSMPGLSGFELVRQILALRPDVVVVMSSGYLDPEAHARASELGAVEVVAKPQSMAEFGRLLHQVLTRRTMVGKNSIAPPRQEAEPAAQPSS